MANDLRSELSHLKARIKNDTSGHPIFRLVSELLKIAIEKGVFSIGSKLPSYRVLSKSLQISKNTVAKAFEVLEEEGLISISNKRGAFVIEPSTERKGPDWNNYFGRGALSIPPIAQHARLRSTGVLDATPNLSHRMDEKWDDFHGVQFIRPFITEALGRLEKGEFSNLYDEQGMPLLREQLSSYLFKRYGIRSNPSQILVLSRRMHAYNLVTETFLAPDICMAFQKVSFLHSYQVGISRVAHRLPLPIDKEGLCIDELDQSGGNKFLFIQPTHSEPTGTITTLNRRKEILDYCNKERIPLLEDAVMDPFYIGSEELPPIKSLENADEVIYLGGVHGPITPGVSLDWIVAPEKIVERLLLSVRRCYQFPSEINQMVISELLKTESFDEFLQQERDLLKSRYEFCFSVLSRYLGDLATWSSNQCWGRIWLTFKEGIEVDKLYMRRFEVDFHPGSLYGDDSNRSILLYVFGKPDQFEEGIKRLRDLVKETFGR